MRIMLIGNAGTGKSTFARRLTAATGWPLLSLDTVWHAMDYSHVAKLKFAQAQRAFMAVNADWIIDGNYGGTMPLRLAQADAIVLLTVPRPLAIARVIRRSLAFRRDPATRPDMAPGFVEHLDADYLDFLKYVWGYNARFAVTTAPLLAQRRPDQRLWVAHNAREKAAVLAALTR
ncbi:AAA family ATPase [Lacticaseibacillus kribbianus]|uniref:AAA family ATPase n=1 Tax=Lacticaseibacillus kribbianus TaxID=2926292 RepID=UPI001CD2EF7D|nr:AAA family ATPase [Lacticaseibacillus kribbianus]